MANSPSFVEHTLDLLSLLGPVQSRSMFGGHGLYAGGVMFGLVDDDELFVKTDATTRPRFLAASCRMWVYPGMEETSWYRPPDEAHEDAEAMLPWATLGLEAALRLKAVKDGAARAKAARRDEREAKVAVRKGPRKQGPRTRTPPVRSATGAARTGPAKKLGSAPRGARARTAAPKKRR